jgi:uncharacterized cupin superfamily protein
MTVVYNLRDGELGALAEAPEGHRFRIYGLADDVGAKLTGLGVYELPPGEAGWPYHFELNEEEWLIVVEGEVTLRTPEGERVLRSGDTVCFPAGAAGAHAVRNASSATARFAMPSAGLPRGGATVYPDSGKYSIYGPGFRHRGKLGEPVEYWEGEA